MPKISAIVINNIFMQKLPPMSEIILQLGFTAMVECIVSSKDESY